MLQRKYPVVVLLILALSAGMTFAQQPEAPSQRFSPERMVPPSVHVPDAKAQPLNSTNALRNHHPTTMNFSDTPASAFRQPPATRRNQPTNTVRQVAFTQDTQSATGSQVVPAVLRESSIKPPTSKTAGQFAPPKSKVHQLRTMPTTSETMSGNGIVVDKTRFANHNSRMKSAVPPNSEEEFSPISRIPSAESAPTTIHQVGFTDEESKKDRSPVRSADFNSFSESEGSAIQRVAAESEMMGGVANMRMSVPAIEVQTYGPESIGINKIATYKVTISNDGQKDATDLQVTVAMPVSVELQNINISSGHHEIGTQEESVTRLTWNLDRLPAGVTHTIALNTIPRTAEPFDLEVAWAVAPQTASSQVTVTEPKLEMKISGPSEVMFGEKANYDVTISNPGTGHAEQVSVMLPDELGGERANIGDVEAGGEKRFKVELLARTAGRLNLTATAVGEGNIKAEGSHEILVRRANLAVVVEGPPMKYAGGLGQYIVTVANDGDAPASGVTAVLAMPSGVKYLGGIKNVEDNNGGLKWQIGTLASGDRKSFKVNCQLDASGSLVFQAGARGTGDLAATHECQTQVNTIADLTLDVHDPKGPLPTGEDVDYKLIIRNRGSRSANGVDVVMQFSEGIDPIKAEGMKNDISTKAGQVVFAPIGRIEPGQEIILKVTAKANKSGTHIFRGQLTCAESDSREIDEGTTRFFGDSINDASQELSLPSKANTADASDEVDSNTNDFK